MSDDITEFEPLDEYAENIIGLIYAEGGSGKTSWGASADNTLIVATEKGTIAASGVHKGKYKNVRVSNCTGDWAQVEATYNKLANNPDLCEKFENIIIDTATEMHRLIKKDIVETRAAKASSKVKNPDKVQIEEYGEQQMRFQRYFGLFNDLGPNVFWLCHSETYDNVHGNPAVRPDLHGQKGGLSAWISAQVYVCGYMSKEQAETKSGGTKTVRKILWDGDEQIRAKTRFDCLPEYTVDWTLDKLVNHIYDHHTQLDA